MKLDFNNITKAILDLYTDTEAIYVKDAESIALQEINILSLCNEYLEQTQELAEEIVRSEKVYGQHNPE